MRLIQPSSLGFVSVAQAFQAESDSAQPHTELV
ncbi:hypothetical protein NIES267_34350 [Calothrix parasitica NIES-267]|uniref:Uncharacterized protein n=1 Tax=Calothrix parasitica NIES-267 TaxID=1973488 RepID=A0A1Z4LS03_9CYAN|nr:hypothetical protein NIES267_34350 [Calothrix parasitica NIES-267]